MKRFFIVHNKDKENIKLVGQSNSGFDLVFLSDDVFKSFLEFANKCEKNNDNICIVWQMKFKKENFIAYNKCTISNPRDNYHPNSPKKTFGKRITVKCESSTFYSTSELYKNTKVNSNLTYKDGKLLDRMLKIDKLRS
jgi:hypothetical protein